MKTAFVTGAGKGLGKGFADYLSDQGFFVFAGVREIKSEYRNKENLEYIICDITSDISIDKCIKEISLKTDCIDLVINNAGVNKDSVTKDNTELVCKLKELRRDLLLKMFDVNTISPIIITQKLLSLLKSNPCFVINISSDRSSYHDEFENSTANYGYRASKAALNMFTFVSVKDLPKNVKTFAVHPGNVKTDMNKSGSQSPYQQAERVIAITKNWNEELNGKFMRWSGEEYPL